VVRGDATVDVVHDFNRPNEQFAAQAIHPPADIIRARAMEVVAGHVTASYNALTA
jgi:hypothetical protein